MKTPTGISTVSEFSDWLRHHGLTFEAMYIAHSGWKVTLSKYDKASNCYLEHVSTHGHRTMIDALRAALMRHESIFYLAGGSGGGK